MSNRRTSQRSAIVRVIRDAPAHFAPWKSSTWRPP